MTMLSPARSALHELEAILLAAKPGESDPVELGEQIEHVRCLLRAEEPIWIDSDSARRLLGSSLDSTVPALVRLGLVRARAGPGDSSEVLLDDILLERHVRDDLLAIGGDEMTTEELKTLAEGRPGQLPWQHSEMPDVA